VHSFANDPTRGVFILGLLALVIGGSLLLFALRAPLLTSGGLFAPISREGGLVLNNILLCSIAAVVITGTMYPLFSDLILGAKLSVGAPFFNAAVLPLCIPLFVAMGIGPVLAWKRAALVPALLRLWWAAVVAVVVGLLLVTRLPVLPALAFAGAAWLIVGAAAEIVERIRLFRMPLGGSVQRLRALPVAAFGAALAHAGMGFTVAGIAGMSLATQKIVLLHPGESVQAAGMTWQLESLEDGAGSNFTARIANLRVSRPGEPDLLMHPSRRTFPVQRTTTTDTAIHTSPLGDIYAVLGEERDGGAVMRLHWNPLAPWIWLGGLIMAIGGGLSLSDRRLRIGAPARRTVAVPAASVHG
jgi:cytochrome c-type biogenesis protein CcmF